MKNRVIVIRENQFEEVKKHFAAQGGKEGAGYLFCGRSLIGVDPWSGMPSRKHLVREFAAVPRSSVVSSSDRHITWETDTFIHGLRRARENGETIGIVHSHPGHFDSFSEQDDRNESDLIALAQKRNGAEAEMLSLVVMPDGRMFARVWVSPAKSIPVDLIIVVGRRIALHYPGRGAGMPQRFFDRQALALGPAFNEDLSQLRIGIVGCGGTGSAVALLLPRLGVKYLALFDDDCVHETNLNRLHFARVADAEASLPKVDVVKRGIEEMELGTVVRGFKGWANDPASRDALKACDIVFGCTDDNSGRIMLNRFAYFYLTPVIDMGLSIDVGDGDPPRVHAFDGRVTVIQPGTTCLLCRGVVNLQLAHAESLKRTDPGEYERQKTEAYVVGEGNPSPAVVPFTTAVAAMAVEELIHRLQGFRGLEGAVDQRLRRFHLITDRRQGEKPSAYCPICASEECWGRGDTVPFLESAV